jgi:hypothetical protein
LRLSNERLQSERQELRRQMTELQRPSPVMAPTPETVNSAALPDGSAGSQTAESEGQGPVRGGFLSKMMEDPEMQQFLREQQRQMLDPLYQPLINKLGLSKEDADAFKDFLADTQMRGAQHATALFGTSATERAQAVDVMAAEQEQNEQAIHEFLGEEGYAQYKDYQETLAERAQLGQFSVQNAGSEIALTDEQTEWLLEVIREEKKAVTPRTGWISQGGIPNPDNLQAMISDEGMEPFLDMQAKVNERVYGRAAEGLSEEQLVAFGRFQTNQLHMMRMGINMAKHMFEPEDAAK